jgi:hypothetical protein
MYDATEVDSAIALLDGTMSAIQAQSGTLNPTDLSTWNAQYASWQLVKSDWAFDKNGSVLPGPIYGGGIMARVQAAQAQAVIYSAKIKAGGGQAPVVPADPSNDNPIPGLGSGGSNWAGTITTVAIVGGAVIPPLTGKIQDLSGSWSMALILPAACYAIIAGFGWYTRARR